MRLAIQGALSGVWTALPGQVTAFDAAALTVEVQPTIKIIQQLQDGTYQAVQMPLLLDVPVVFQRGGGATLTFPIAVGDECLVVFANRNIDGWWQSGGVQLPLDARRFDLSDGFALVGPFSQPNVIGGYSASEVQLRSNDGLALFGLNPTTGALRIKAPGGLTIIGDISHTGSQRSTGDVVAGTISLKNHVHTQGNDSHGDTEVPTNAPTP